MVTRLLNKEAVYGERSRKIKADKELWSWQRLPGYWTKRGALYCAVQTQSLGVHRSPCWRLQLPENMNKNERENDEGGKNRDSDSHDNDICGDYD